MKYGGTGQDLVIWGDCGGVIRVGWSGTFPHIHYIILHILPIANAKLHVVKKCSRQSGIEPVDLNAHNVYITTAVLFWQSHHYMLEKSTKCLLPLKFCFVSFTAYEHVISHSVNIISFWGYLLWFWVYNTKEHVTNSAVICLVFKKHSKSCKLNTCTCIV